MARVYGQGCLLVVLLASIAGAARVPWQSTNYEHVATNQSIVELLREFAADQGVAISLSENVAGTVSGRFGPMPPGAFFDQITRSNGLVWYFDGHSLHVFRSDELQSLMIPVRSVSLQEALQSLRDLDMLSDRFPVRTLPDLGLLQVTGPPRYLQTISETLASVEQAALAKVNVNVVVRVFPLRYAWADDQTFSFGDAQVIVPGVATILRSVVSGQRDPNAPSGRVVLRERFNDLPGLRGRGLIEPRYGDVRFAQQAAIDAEVAARSAEATVQAQDRQFARAEQMAAVRAAQAEGDGGASLPAEVAEIQGVIEADPRLNALIVRDLEQKMEYYERIIADLDETYEHTRSWAIHGYPEIVLLRSRPVLVMASILHTGVSTQMGTSVGSLLSLT